MKTYTFEVTHQRLVTYQTTVAVEANTEEEALRLADDAQESDASWDAIDSDIPSGPNFRLIEVEE